MKLSISNIAWDNKDNNKIYNLMVENDYSGLEIAPTKIFPNNPYDLLDEAEAWAKELKNKYKFSISSIQSIWYGRTEKIFESFDERQILINYTKKAIDFASVIECKNLVFGCPKNRNIDSDEDYKIAIEFFKELGDYAYSKNTCLGMEANPKIYNTNFINNTHEAIDLIKKVDSNGFKLNLDIGTIIENNEDIDELVGNVHLINHVHISEPYLEQIQPRDLHKKILTILKNENYDKFISIEMKQQENLQDVKQVMQYLKLISGVQ